MKRNFETKVLKPPPSLISQLSVPLLLSLLSPLSALRSCLFFSSLLSSRGARVRWSKGDAIRLHRIRGRTGQRMGGWERDCRLQERRNCAVQVSV